jgi:hypothetical protein
MQNKTTNRFDRLHHATISTMHVFLARALQGHPAHLKLGRHTQRHCCRPGRCHLRHRSFFAVPIFSCANVFVRQADVAGYERQIQEIDEECRCLLLPTCIFASVPLHAHLHTQTCVIVRAICSRSRACTPNTRERDERRPAGQCCVRL